jgi:hypothetical protein
MINKDISLISLISQYHMFALLYAVLAQVMTTQGAFHALLTRRSNFYTWVSVFSHAPLAQLNKTKSA